MRTVGLVIAWIWLLSSALVFVTFAANLVSARARRWIRGQLFGNDPAVVPVKLNVLGERDVLSASPAGTPENSRPAAGQQLTPADDKPYALA